MPDKIFQVGDIFVSASSYEEAETKARAIARRGSVEVEASFEASIAAIRWIAAIVEEESDVAI